MADLPTNQQGSAGGTDIVSTLQGIIRQLTALYTNGLTLIATISAIFPRTFGTITLAAANQTVVAQPAVKANSQIMLIPTNTAAGTLMGSSKSLYIKAISAGVSFTVGTADGTNAAGTETFSYNLVSPA